MNAIDLFKKTEAVLEYRPVRHAGTVRWFWVLLPLPAENTALATGSGDSKGEASLMARTAARKAHCRITKVRVNHPSFKQQQAGPEPPEPLPL